jgi:hypothetical protein
MSRDWYTLTYTTREGSHVMLRNLQDAGASYIRRVQTELGSHSFQQVLQGRHYSQQEIDLLREVRS